MMTYSSIFLLMTLHGALGQDYPTGFILSEEDEQLLDLPHSIVRGLDLHTVAGGNVPHTLNWAEKGKMLPVKNQGGCGSCWAFAATDSLASRHAIKNGRLHDLSEKHVLDCTYPSSTNGCNGGHSYTAWKNVGRKGITINGVYPNYNEKDEECPADSEFVNKYPREAFAGESKDDPTVHQYFSNKHELKQDIAQYGPCVMYMGADDAFMSLKKGIWSCNPSTTINHAVTVVGWGVENGPGCPDGYSINDKGKCPGSGTCCVKSWTSACGEECAKARCTSVSGKWIPLDYWKNPYTCEMPLGHHYWTIKNSWGTGWGDNGFGRISMDNCSLGSSNGVFFHCPEARKVVIPTIECEDRYKRSGGQDLNESFRWVFQVTTARDWVQSKGGGGGLFGMRGRGSSGGHFSLFARDIGGTQWHPSPRPIYSLMAQDIDGNVITTPSLGHHLGFWFDMELNRTYDMVVEWSKESGVLTWTIDGVEQLRRDAPVGFGNHSQGKFCWGTGGGAEGWKGTIKMYSGPGEEQEAVLRRLLK